MSRTATFLTWVASLAAIAATGSSTLAWAKHPLDTQKDSLAITLRVYDYAHEDRSTVLAAEGVAATILAQAGIEAHSMDCPTLRADFDRSPDCKSAMKANDFVVRVLPNTMLHSRGPVQDAWGLAYETDGLSAYIASVFYDRVLSFSQGARAPLPDLLGWAMAHEIGHLLLGTNSHSSMGIMRGSWFGEDLSVAASPHMLFTKEQSRRMKTRLAERLQSSQVQSQGQAVELGR